MDKKRAMLKKMVSRCGTNLMVKQNVDAEVDDKLLCVTFSHIISFSYRILQDCKFFFAYLIFFFALRSARIFIIVQMNSNALLQCIFMSILT